MRRRECMILHLEGLRPQRKKAPVALRLILELKAAIGKGVAANICRSAKVQNLFAGHLQLQLRIDPAQLAKAKWIDDLLLS